MNVLIYIEDVLGFHFATDLEFAVKHLRRGDEVHLLTCQGGLQTCPANNVHDAKTCILCRSKLHTGLEIDELEDAEVHVLDLDRYKETVSIPSFSTIDDLKDFEIDGINHGMEAASTMISALRKPRPDMGEHRDLVERSLFTAIAVYRASLRRIEELQPDRCYVLNGRRASQMPFVRAAWEKDRKLYTFEVGHDADKYILVEDTYFHDLDNKKREIEEYWSDDTPFEEKKELADQFFRDRRYGSGEKYLEAQFKEEQRQGALPGDFDASRRNVVIFNSSEDEFAAVEGYENPVYETQVQGIHRIIENSDLDDDIHIYLRVHPSLTNVENYQTRAIEQLEADNLSVIPANSDVDSYALMEACEKVVTFGSAMSIESAYAGKPSILLGREPYEDLGACYTPDSHEEAIALLNDPGLPPRDQLGALKYGYYVVSRDRAYDFHDPQENTLFGQELLPSRLARYKVMYLEKGALSVLSYVVRRLSHYASELLGLNPQLNVPTRSE